MNATWRKGRGCARRYREATLLLYARRAERTAGLGRCARLLAAAPVWREFLSSLLDPHCLHRIDAGGTPRRDHAGNQRADSQRPDGRRQHQRVIAVYLKKP
jgi:hypothetical protein